MLGGTEKLSLKDQTGKPYVIEAGQVRFAVEETFKGSGALEVTIRVESRIGDSCGPYGLRRGERYVVYAYTDETKKVLSTGACTRTRVTSSEYAKEDLDFLKNLPPPGVGGNLRGLIYTDVKDTDTPLPDVMVRISNTDGQVITAFTNKKGRFEVKQLKPGKYKVEPEFPANYTSEKKSLELDIDDRGTADATFVAFMDGKVSGKVFDREGKSFNHISLEMIGKGKQLSGYSTGEDGAFEVEGVPPGEYFLYLEMQGSGNSKAPYYYPGTFDYRKAVPIRVGLGEKVEGLEFRLPRSSIVRTFEGEVVWKDGTPAAGVEVLLLCPRSFTPNRLTVESGSVRTQTNDQGRFRIEGFTGESYLITARGRKQGTEEGELIQMHSPERKISVGESVNEMKLTLSNNGYYGKGACPKF